MCVLVCAGPLDRQNEEQGNCKKRKNSRSSLAGGNVGGAKHSSHEHDIPLS